MPMPLRKQPLQKTCLSRDYQPNTYAVVGFEATPPEITPRSPSWRTAIILSPSYADSRYDMPAAPEFLDDLGGNALIDVHPAGVGLSRVERRRSVRDVEVPAVERLLDAHPEVDVIEQELQRPLVLPVTAGGAECEAGLGRRAWRGWE